MLDRLLIALSAVVLAGLTLLLLAGHGPWAGPKVISLTYNHGVNEGDIPVLIAWAVGTGCLGWLWVRR